MPDQFGMAIVSVTLDLLMKNINLGIGNTVRYSHKPVISESGTSENPCDGKNAEKFSPQLIRKL